MRKRPDRIIHLACARCGSNAIERVTGRVLRCTNCGTEGGEASTKFRRGRSDYWTQPDLEGQASGGYRRRPIRHDE